jgi:signal transduction histidine kinase/ligand-binding sensor domain-containing protein/DNA-binding response OmpR family regulator
VYSIHSQAKNISFTNFSSKDGLAQNTVNDIIQDSNGFIWVGTNGGLSRFDGYEFLNFRMDFGDTTSLMEDVVPTLFIDSKNNFWIGTNAGVNLYRHEDESFVRLLPQKLNYTIQSFAEDKHGNIWIGTEWNGLIKLNISSNEIRLFNTENGFLSDAIFEIYNDEDGLIWVGTSQGAVVFEPKIGDQFETFHNIVHESGRSNSLNNNEVYSIFKDSKGTVWLGTNKGINRLIQFDNNFENAVFDYVLNDESNTNSLSHNNIRSFWEDDDGSLWCATRGGGINQIRVENNSYKIIKYLSDSEKVNTLVHNDVLNGFKDDLGNIWLSTQSGISKLTIEENIFQINQHKYRDLKSIASNTVSSFVEDSNGNIWIGTNQGLCYLDKSQKGANRKDFITFPFESGKSSLQRINRIQTLCLKKNGLLYIGSKAGVLIFDTEKKQYILDSKLIKLVDNHFLELYVRKILIDKQQRVWLGTNGKGILIYNKKDESLKGLTDSNGEPVLHNAKIFSMLFESDTVMWAGTINNGLYRITYSSHDLTMKKIEHFHKSSNNGLTSDFITYLYSDSTNRIWIATSKGLFYWCPQDSSFTAIDYFLDFPNYIAGILEDNQNRLWVAGLSGFYVFNFKNNTVQNLNFSIGVLTTVNYTFDCLLSSSGNVYFGGLNGLTIVDPSKVKTQNEDINLQFTDLYLLNKRVAVNDKNSNRKTLQKSIHQTDKIELTYKEYNFSLKFAALNAVQPERIKYRHKLEGFDDNWIISDSKQRIANYSNLKPGKYTLKIQSSNSQGIWMDNTKSISIVSLTPWWTSWWMILIYFLVILQIIVLLRKIVVNREKLKNTILVEKVKSEQKEKINQLKLRFFTNISHDLKTPVSLITGPAGFLMQNKNQISEIQKQKYVSLIYRHSLRLTGLINQLIEFRKAETGSLKLKCGNIELVSFLKSITEDFQYQAEENSTHLFFESTLENLNIFADAKKLDRIVFNLLSNAFTHAGSKSDVWLKLSKISGKEDFCSIVVEDHGKGIEKNNIERIFDRFYQGKNENGAVKGSGIGLALVKSLTELHEGNIRIESEPNVKTSFIIELPINSGELNDSEKIIVESGFGQNITNYSKNNEENIEFEADSYEKETILIVEDNRDLRDFIKDCLKNKFNVICADAAEKAFDILEEASIDLILSDIMLPGKDGIHLCHQVKQSISTSHIPVVLITAISEDEAQINGYKSGADGYLQKPLNYNVLFALIETLLEQRKNLKERFNSDINVNADNLNLTPVDEDFLISAQRLVEKNISDSNYKVDDFIDELKMSRSMVYRKLQKITGKSPIDFIQTIKLKKAAQLLLQNKYTISEIAYSSGFNDPRYFSRSFKKQFELTPTEYIEKFHSPEL